VRVGTALHGCGMMRHDVAGSRLHMRRCRLQLRSWACKPRLAEPRTAHLGKPQRNQSKIFSRSARVIGTRATGGGIVHLEI